MQLFRAALEFLSFMVAIFAAVVALQLYALLKTGEIGRTWRVLILGAGIFALHTLIGIGHYFDYFDDHGTYELSQLLCIIVLAYAFWLQRSAFCRPRVHREEIPENQQAFPSRFERLQFRSDLLESEFDLEEDMAATSDEV